MERKISKWQRGLVLCLFIGGLFILGACSSNESSGEGEDSDALQVWTMSGGLKEFVTEFEDANGAKVEVQTIPWANAHDKLLTAVASGKGPDVIQIGTTWVAEFAEAGAFMDLSDKIGDYENLKPDHFYEGAIGTTTYEDKTIAVPWYVDTRLLFYRTDILGEVGYPEGPETWEDMIDASRKLADRGEGQFAVDLPANDPQFPFMMAWQQGWEYEVGAGADNFDSPDFKKAVELHHLFYDEGLSQMEEGKEFFQSFADGSKPMFFSGPWDIKTIKERAPEIEGNWDVHVMPEADNNKSMMGGAHLAVFHNSDKEDLALEFIDWMADKDTQLKWYEENSELPANKEAWEDPLLSEDPMVSTFGEQLESTQPLPLIPEFERLGQELITKLEEINRGGKNIDDAIQEYKADTERVLAD
ncbi:sugar ABC transporter substrate-binding protein [Bacillus sp. SB49]|uniref:sugar ABC transporter substrate-binding protein n=1 Tax=Bacillaceae TaxID=186817 RepID=UPI0002A4D5AD|nr:MULTISPECIES: sugar ABC transporter substrate-binding protein [Bacillaceae]ELK47770.1 family 1 extracellular solute-binding protein [Halobacillus sp. BAB-2008]QHT45454.1 sugar ABC transporter substrate-binding protein [Bacillus sp. SB49]